MLTARATTGSTSDVEPADWRVETAQDRPDRGAALLLDEIVRRAPEMTLLRQLGAGLLHEGGNGGEAACLRAVLADAPDLADHTLLLLRSGLPGAHAPVETIDEAVARFSTDCVRSHAIAVMLSNLASESSGSLPARRRVWRHMIWVALCSRLLARHCGVPHPDAAFVAGLLHDIAYLLEERCAPVPFAAAVRMAEAGSTMRDAERAQMGFDHSQLGAKIARICGFPWSVASSLAFHHRSSDSPEEDRLIVQCVQVADAICSLGGAWSFSPSAVTLPLGAMRDLGLGKGGVRMVVDSLEKQAVAFETVLNRPGVPFAPQRSGLAEVGTGR